MGRLETIFARRGGRFQISGAGELYWNGRRVVTELKLPGHMDLAAWIVAGASMVVAVFTALGFFFRPHSEGVLLTLVSPVLGILGGML